jgi:hypothetical protein
LVRQRDQIQDVGTTPGILPRFEIVTDCGAIQSQSQIETLLWMVHPYSRVKACAPTLRTDTRRHTRGCAATGLCRGLPGTLRAAKCVIEFKPRTAQVLRVNLTRWADRDCRI